MVTIMRIGIDIDGVINNLEQFHIEYGTLFCFLHQIKTIPDTSQYEVRNMFQWEENNYHLFQKLYYKDFFLTNKYVRSFAKDVINYLQQVHEVYIITARKEHIAQIMGKENIAAISKRWLDDIGIKYDEFIITDVTKIESIQNNKVDVIIEDSPYFLSHIMNKPHISTICFDANYNRHFTGTHIMRAYSWYDILRIINTIQTK